MPRPVSKGRSRLASQGDGTVDLPGQGWPAYLWARGSWKTSCHTERALPLDPSGQCACS